jgi:hypothetical protein
MFRQKNGGLQQAKTWPLCRYASLQTPCHGKLDAQPAGKTWLGDVDKQA